MVKCIKCGTEVCKGKAAFYSDPLNKMCTKCRTEEIEKKGLLELDAKIEGVEIGFR